MLYIILSVFCSAILFLGLSFINLGRKNVTNFFGGKGATPSTHCVIHVATQKPVTFRTIHFDMLYCNTHTFG